MWLEALMSVEMLLRVLLQIALLTGSAFFSGSEVALFSVSRLDLEQLRRARHPKVGVLYELLEQPRRLIISILCGNELINVAASANMAAIVVALVGVEDAAWLNLLIMAPLLLLFGEVTPKTIAIANPVGISGKIVAGPMHAWVRLIAPIRWLIRIVSDRLTTWLVGAETSAENILQIDEVRTLATMLQESGELMLEERILVDRLLESGVREVVDVMVPRTQTVFLDVETPITEVLDVLQTHKRIRIPVYEGHPDKLVGFLHAEDFVEPLLAGVDPRDLKLADLLHPVVVVPPTKFVDEMLDFFRKQRVQAAAVVNEFGGVEGFVTTRTIVDFVFDSVCAQTPVAERYRVEQAEGYEFEGDTKLALFNDVMKSSLADTRMSTIGGVVFRHLDRLPIVGDEVTIDGVRLKVVEMAGHRIKRLHARRAERLDREVE